MTDKLRRIRRAFAGILAVLPAVMLFCGTDAFAAGYDLPTLYHNDEAWYKDSMAPLLVKDGRYHIPADLLGMFGELTVSYHAGQSGQNSGNLLVTRTDGTYVSILFADKTAVIDGQLHENVGIFRENGYTYVDGEWIAAIFSLTCSYTRTEDGRTLLRLTDGTETRTMDELLGRYREEAGQTEEEQQTEEPRTEEDTGDGIRRVYIVTGDNYENPEFTAVEKIIENSGLVCTMFLHERSDEAKMWDYAFLGSAGICAGSVMEADAVNEKLESLFYRRLEYVLPAHESTDREALRQAGYIVIEPDFVVDYSTDPDAVYAGLTAFLEENDSAVVKVSGDGCSQRMIALLCNLTADPAYCRTDVLLP